MFINEPNCTFLIKISHKGHAIPNLEEAAAVETFLVRVVFIYQGTSGDLLSLLAAAAVAALVHERKLALAIAADASNCANVTKQKIVLANATKAYYCLAFVIMHYHSIVLPIGLAQPNTQMNALNRNIAWHILM